MQDGAVTGRVSRKRRGNPHEAITAPRPRIAQPRQGVVSGTVDSFGSYSIQTFYGPYAAGTAVTVENQYRMVCATETAHLPPGQILAVSYLTP